MHNSKLGKAISKEIKMYTTCTWHDSKFEKKMYFRYCIYLQQQQVLYKNYDYKFK